jgi:hypothetical protein
VTPLPRPSPHRGPVPSPGSLSALYDLPPHGYGWWKISGLLPSFADGRLGGVMVDCRSFARLATPWAWAARRKAVDGTSPYRRSNPRPGLSVCGRGAGTQEVRAEADEHKAGRNRGLDPAPRTLKTQRLRGRRRRSPDQPRARPGHRCAGLAKYSATEPGRITTAAARAIPSPSRVAGPGESLLRGPPAATVSSAPGRSSWSRRTRCPRPPSPRSR